MLHGPLLTCQIALYLVIERMAPPYQPPTLVCAVAAQLALMVNYVLLAHLVLAVHPYNVCGHTTVMEKVAPIPTLALSTTHLVNVRPMFRTHTPMQMGQHGAWTVLGATLNSE